MPALWQALGLAAESEELLRLLHVVAVKPSWDVATEDVVDGLLSSGASLNPLSHQSSKTSSFFFLAEKYTDSFAVRFGTKKNLT